MFKGDYVTVDNPNLSQPSPGIPLGEMVDAIGPYRSYDELRPLRNVNVNDMYLPNVTLRNMTGQIAQNAVFVNKSHQGADLVASCLFLDGTVTSTLPGESRGIVVSRGLQALKYDPNSEFRHWVKADTPFNIVHLSIAPSFLFSLLPDDESWTGWLREQVEQRKRILSDVPPHITGAQHRVLENILHCPMQGKMGLLMLETSIIQLILFQLHAQFGQFVRRPLRESATRDGVSYEVKDHLDKTFLDTHSITSLASQFGTNTSKLMSMFKRTFGLTIFEYIHELKMEHARLLIADKGYHVAEAAREVGYKNPHHFTSAFKRRHGIKPSTLKTQG